MSGETILVADDSMTIRVQVCHILTKAGYNVVEAASGREALDRIDEECPSLAIVDVNMPDMDGYGVCQTLQEKGTPYREIPIVLLTSLNSHALEVLGDELGAYLQKPVNPDALLSTIELHARRPGAVQTTQA